MTHRYGTELQDTLSSYGLAYTLKLLPGLTHSGSALQEIIFGIFIVAGFGLGESLIDWNLLDLTMCASGFKELKSVRIMEETRPGQMGALKRSEISSASQLSFQNLLPATWDSGRLKFE